MVPALKQAYSNVAGYLKLRYLSSTIPLEPVQYVWVRRHHFDPRYNDLASEKQKLESDLVLEREQTSRLKQKIENMCMYLEDLESVNMRQRDRKEDLVHAYWPLIHQFREMKDENNRLNGGVASEHLGNLHP